MIRPVISPVCTGSDGSALADRVGERRIEQAIQRLRAPFKRMIDILDQQGVSDDGYMAAAHVARGDKGCFAQATDAFVTLAR